MINLLSSFADNLQTGGFTFILGMLVIFGGMEILVADVSLVGKLMMKNDKTVSTKKEQEVINEVQAPQVVEVSNDEIPEDVRVAIIAAIAAYYTQSGSKNEFKVRKIKKI